ncbi:hypothetical protein B4123_0310 [Bacillus paralicheniformis]|nr:hypothetical protein B4123_0310 [Bacillus paralicheniformis]TWN33020.1 hypothetical protein CHCC14527_0148 [Bacillus paralicheniformis]
MSAFENGEGSFSRSTIQVRTPAKASSEAVIRPTGPPPAISTSKSMMNHSFFVTHETILTYYK